MRPMIHLGLGLLAAGVLAACSAQDERKQEPAKAVPAGAAAVQTVTSKDGTKIAYDKVGSGPAVILVNGALADRAAGLGLAKLLAQHFTVYTFDRRGRGDSGDTKPYSVRREIEDIEALADHVGGTVSLVGFSSGAALALEAASALGPKVTKLAVYEAPYDDAPGEADKWKRYRGEQGELLAAGRRGEAVQHHLAFVGVPEPAVAQLKASPAWVGMEAMAPTLPHDVAVIGDDRAVPVARIAKVLAKTLVMDGGASRAAMPFMRATADRIAGAIPNAQRRTIEGQAHNASPEAIAPVLIAFLGAS
jgi:pimeloyl-ACP methyl ester carboxylesterase